MTVPQWRSLFGQLGRSGALQDVHKLTLWLVVWYTERVESLAFDREPSDSAAHILSRIFDSTFQCAIIYWALKEQFATKSGIVRQPWQTTLMLLQYLQTDCAIPLRLWTIRKTIVLYVRGLFHRSMHVPKGRGVDSRQSDSRKMCFRLFKTLNEFLSRNLTMAQTEREIASSYLTEQKNLRAREMVVAARPTLRKAMRRLSHPTTFTFNNLHRASIKHV